MKFSVLLRFVMSGFLFTCLMAHGQNPCGTQVTTGASVPKVLPSTTTNGCSTKACSDYTTFLSSPPNYTDINLAVGGSYVDGAFGNTPAGNPSCTVTRLTRGDNITPTPRGSWHAYKYSPISCDDTLELIGSPDIGSWKLLNVPSGSMFRSSLTGVTPDNNAQPLWAHCGHARDHVLYWHDVSGPRIYSYNADTDTNTTLHDFSSAGETACGGSPCTRVCWGCSSNGPHNGFPANGDDTIGVSGLSGGGTWYAWVYDVINNRIWPGFTPVAASSAFPWVSSLPSHRLLVSYSNGFNLYDSTGAFVHYVPYGIKAHNEAGLDSSGAEVVYWDMVNDVNAPGGCQSAYGHGPGIGKINVDTNVVTCVQDSGWGGHHVSVSQDGKWIATSQYSTYGQQDNCTKAYYNANPSLAWDTYFTRPPNDSLYMDELMISSTDGTKTYRMANHRSVVMDSATCSGTSLTGGGYDYWTTPRTAISYSGKYIAFSSNFGVGVPATVHSFNDEWVLTTGLTNSGGTALGTPTNLTATVH